MPIDIKVKNPIIYEQILSYKNCKNLIRSSMIHTNNLRRNIYCTLKNTGKTAKKIVAWLSVTNLETKERYDDLPKVYCSKIKEKTLKAGEETTETFRLETPRMTGMFELRLNAKVLGNDDARESSIIIPSLKRVLGTEGIEFHQMDTFQVYSHRTGIQHNNQCSLFLFQTRKSLDTLLKLAPVKKRTISTVLLDTKTPSLRSPDGSDSSDSDSDFEPRRHLTASHKKHKRTHSVSKSNKRKNRFDVSSDEEVRSRKPESQIDEPLPNKKTKLEPTLSVQEVYELECQNTESEDSTQDLVVEKQSRRGGSARNFVKKKKIANKNTFY